MLQIEADMTLINSIRSQLRSEIDKKTSDKAIPTLSGPAMLTSQLKPRLYKPMGLDYAKLQQ